MFGFSAYGELNNWVMSCARCTVSHLRSVSYEGFSPASQAALGETGLTGGEEQESSPALKRKKTPLNMRENCDLF